MKIIDWNISYSKDPKPKYTYLKTLLENKSIAILQEVTPSQYEICQEIMGDKFKIEYSLNYRKPGKYDTKQRKLGIAIITTNDIDILSAKCLDRCLLPDRTLLIEIKVNDKILKVLGLHSITGCDHKKAKSMQFLSFAEAVNEYRPDIVAIDANEPQIDHYDISRMVFFDNKDKGEGAKTFFKELTDFGLKDSYSINYKENNYVNNEPLTISHIINKRIKVRYDFIFTNQKVNKSDYHYEEAICAGSDHALIECDITL